jgi:hypothetical protein
MANAWETVDETSAFATRVPEKDAFDVTFAELNGPLVGRADLGCCGGRGPGCGETKTKR